MALASSCVFCWGLEGLCEGLEGLESWVLETMQDELIMRNDRTKGKSEALTRPL
jgi:hypothetical protein